MLKPSKVASKPILSVPTAPELISWLPTGSFPFTSSYLSLAPPTHTRYMHKTNADTGTTGHCMSYQDMSTLANIEPALHPITVTLPAGTTATSTHTALLNLPQLPLAARKVHLFPDFVGSLLSICILCDHGMTAVYTHPRPSPSPTKLSMSTYLILAAPH